MFKKISVFLVLVLVVTTLSACAGGGLGTNQLDSETKKAVEEAWYGSNGSWSWAESNAELGCSYYGKFGGYDIVYSGLGMDVIHEIKIGKHIFQKGNYFELYAYRNGKCTLLKSLYEEGKIRDKYIKEILEYHNSNGASLSLSEEEKMYFFNTFMKMQSPINWQAKDGEPGAIRYLGNHCGYDVFILNPTMVKSSQNEMTFGEITITFPCEGGYFFAYKDNTFYWVWPLYENKTFDDNTMAAIAEQNELFNNS